MQLTFLVLQNSTSETKKASVSLDVVIVGGGVSGLATAYTLGRVGHRITIIEGDKWLGEIGAGIQAAPSESHVGLNEAKHTHRYPW